jgi:hypothetical protein
MDQSARSGNAYYPVDPDFDRLVSIACWTPDYTFQGSEEERMKGVNDEGV